MKKIVLSAAVSAALSVPALAQSQDTAERDNRDLVPTLETLVVVSSRQQTPLREVATSVAVLDEAQIKARGFTALADTLRTLPSVTVSSNGGMGKASSLRVRGESGYRTMVRIDGVDVTDPSGPQAGAQIQHILSANVGRVELLRGPQGLMYGADAGGVLNIDTRRVEEGHQGQLSAEAGSFDTQRYNASVGGTTETADYFLSGAYVDTAGFNAHVKDEQLQDDDGYENTTLHGRVGWNITDNLRTEAVLRDTDAVNELDQCGWPTTVNDCWGDFNQTNARLSLAHKTERFDNELAYSNTDIKRKNYAAGAVSYDTEGDIEKLEWLGRAALNSSHQFAYGLEQRSDRVLDMQRDQWGAYAEYQGHYGRSVYLTAGVRRDDNDDFGEHDTYRVSGAWVAPLAAGSLKFKTSYGTGFRAPSLFEIDYNRSLGNPDLAPLEPEESEGLDIGVAYYGDTGLHLEAVYFEQTIEREIEWDSGYVQGQGESTSEGVELIFDQPVASWLVVNANYTYTDATNAEGSVRARVPKNMANLGLTFLPFDGLKASVHVRAADGAKDRTGKALDDYQVLNASVRFAVNRHITVYARGENLTDEDYVEVPDYNTAGASGYAGVEVSF